MKVYSASLIAPIVLAASLASAQHLHFVAGAEAPVQNAKLIAVNSNEFLHTFGYVRTLTFSSSGTYASFYNASCPFVVAAATPPFGGPEAGAPALGAFIQAEIISLEGPAGGTLGYWEVGQTGSPTFGITVGTTNATNRFAISDASLGAGQPGADPYGHFHGRRFTADVPGFYTLGYRFLDTSANGLPSGPIHQPSEIYYLYLQAGITIPFVAKTPDGIEITYGTAIGRNYFVEFSQFLGSAAKWSDVHGPVEGNDRLQTFLHANSGTATGFYRIREETP